jgi:putative ABC transport system permease protein
MHSLFGIPMNIIMVVLLVLLGISLATVAVAALLNRVMFLVGLRNIPRRRAQTTLIIIGLMLSTLIISAAFTTGDTVDYSISSTVYDVMGHVDEVVEFESQEGSAVGAANVSIPSSTVQQLEAGVGNDPDIDGIAPALVETVPAVNERVRLNAPAVTALGVDPARMEAFPDVVNLKGQLLDIGALGEDQVYLNESAADELGAQVGDTVTIYYQNQPLRFQVANIVQDRMATGELDTENPEGMVARQDVLQRAFGREGEVDFVLISNRGGVRDSLALSGPVTEKLKDVIESQGLRLGVEETKRESIDFAEAFGNGMMTFFLVLGLFSIAAGILLIIMIFVMLAAERKTEMGIIRAVGTKRRHLVQMFMSEGLGYNLLSALVGVFLGVLVALALTGIMAALFSEFDISIRSHVTARSLIISYSLGVVLTFLSVVFSSWRVSALNIVRAIRDLAEPPAVRMRWHIGRGRLAFLRYLARLFFRPAGRRKWARNLGLFLAAGVLGALAGATSSLAALAGLFGTLAALLVAAGVFLTFRIGILSIVGGLALVLTGLATDAQFPYALGVSLAVLGVVLTLDFAGLPQRPVFTTAGLLLLAFWALGAGGRIPPELESGGIEMFFLSGIVMVAAATFVVIYNADLLLAVVSRVGGRLGRILPAVKTAVAYPLANKFRTGMTMAMISLVVFALVVMSTMNANFNRLFLSEGSRGGWDVQVDENPNNPIADLRQALDQEGSVDTSKFTSLGKLGVAPFSTSELRQAGQEEFKFYEVKGADDEFLRTANLPLQARATGYDTDEAVWESIRTQPNLAVIDLFAVPQGFAFGGFDMFTLDGITATTTTFEPIKIQVHDRATAVVGEVQLIGLLNSGASGGGPVSSFGGLITSERLVREVFGHPEYSMYFIRLQDPHQAKATADAIEAALFTKGAQAVSIKAERQDEVRLFSGFFYLMQAFMGLGLVVGIAAVGVIAFRTVVERRQQIGMLRAIGYTRGTVALSFLMESSFVTIMGILTGLGLAILLSYFIMTSDELTATGLKGFYIPWLEILLICAFAYGASLLMTFVPSRQASSIPIAEALRYE